MGPGVFEGATARLLVGNDGEEPLELVVEPWGACHALPPGRTWVVVTHSPAAHGSWPGTRRAGEPFEVLHRSDAVTVWANGGCFHLGDVDGHAVDAAAEECPAGGPPRGLTA
ncbi:MULTISPECIES: hypothetical protein [Streptomyces]|uniref:DUF4232 domain-containing protein n=1 Tax=Streptomyces chilikensis TaxID=1194079 RepID=A0ABV3EY90_9ACTN|nr:MULTISPECIES: hypothetical protein [Streptomyces]MDH6226568.1 hypothetical protein [Streptomyces sp. MJP52]